MPPRLLDHHRGRTALSLFSAIAGAILALWFTVAVAGIVVLVGRWLIGQIGK